MASHISGSSTVCPKDLVHINVVINITQMHILLNLETQNELSLANISAMPKDAGNEIPEAFACIFIIIIISCFP